MFHIMSVMVRPIIRFCIRRSITIQDFTEASKTIFLEEAAKEIAEQGKRVNVSKLSAITGLHRKDVVRIHREGAINESSTNFAARVVTQWRKDRRFLTKNGRPRVLEYRGESNEFSKLCELVSTDIRSGAVLFDLERVGAVERTPSGLKLVAKAYVPKGDPIEEMKLLAYDTEDLIEGVLANIYSEETERPNYHGNFSYDNIDPEELPKIRKWLFAQCANFHKRVSNYLSKMDLDITPRSNKDGGARVAVLLCTRSTDLKGSEPQA